MRRIAAACLLLLCCAAPAWAQGDTVPNEKGAYALSKVGLEYTPPSRMNVRVGSRGQKDVVMRDSHHEPEMIFEFERARAATCSEALAQAAKLHARPVVARGGIAPSVWADGAVVLATDAPAGAVVCVKGEGSPVLGTVYYDGTFGSKDYQKYGPMVLAGVAAAAGAKDEARVPDGFRRPVATRRGKRKRLPVLDLEVVLPAGSTWVYEGQGDTLRIGRAQAPFLGYLMTKKTMKGLTCDAIHLMFAQGGGFGVPVDPGFLPGSWHQKVLVKDEGKVRRASFCLDLGDDTVLVTSVAYEGESFYSDDFARSGGVFMANLAAALGVEDPLAPGWFF